ncbi:MAG: EAL domain-containing protein [Pseudomonadota bacterium]
MAMRDMLIKRLSRQSGTADDRAPSQLDSSARLALLEAFENSDLAWFWATDAAGRINYLSPNAMARCGADEEVLGKPLVNLLETVGDDGETNGERPLNFLLSSHTRFQDIVVRLLVGEREEWWQLNGRPHVNGTQTFCGFRGSAKDVTDQFVRQRDQSRLAQFDDLSGLANRHRMQQRLDSIMAAFKLARRSCALLMLDLDKFKKVNDTLGHPAGDELLRQVAQRLRGILVSPAEIGRLGGDEFQIIIPDMDDRGHLGDLAKKIIQMLSQPYALGADRAIIGASVGIAIAPYDGVTAEELVKNADLALYASKGGGRGQYRFFASDLAKAAQRQREIGEDLRAALDAGQLSMNYQPIVRGCDNTVVGFEALLRWDHPELGPISPATFVPIAEELNLTTRLGEWALHQACHHAATWPGDIRVTVNVSPQLFFSGALVSAVEEALDASGLRANRLELDVSEGVFMGEGSQVDKTFARLARRGVRLTLDDFGTGYSSLAFLRRAPFEKIKIDPSFVLGCAEAGNPNAAIIAAIVSLARALDLQTTASGVEAMDELRTVLEHGATYIQGFIFSRPVPQDVVLAKLEQGDFVFEPVGPENHRAERRTMLLRIGVIHEDHRYEATLRNLSRTGAMIEGLLDVPVGADLVLDLGGGQLAVGTVRRSQDATQGVQFETPLISDGANGLCTRHRVSPYQLAAAGGPLAQLGADAGQQAMPSGGSRRRFIQVDISAGSARAA